MTRRTRPRGFAPWQPRPDTLALLQHVNRVLAEYAEHLPLTCRQIFYCLVAGGFDKTEPAYARLCEAIGRARRAGLLPFEAIRDDGANRLEPAAYADADDFLDAALRAAEGFRLDRQAGQPVRLVLAVEAAGMAPMLAAVAGQYGVPVLPSGGFDSLTAKHAMARDLARWPAAEVLHIGDLDPSGVHLFAALAEDVAAMVAAIGGRAPRFSRLAVTREQADLWNLPTAPPKPTDRRSFTGETVQAEAIAPDRLAAMARSAIEARQDPVARLDVIHREAAERAALLARLTAR